MPRRKTTVLLALTTGLLSVVLLYAACTGRQDKADSAANADATLQSRSGVGQAGSAAENVCAAAGTPGQIPVVEHQPQPVPGEAYANWAPIFTSGKAFDIGEFVRRDFSTYVNALPDGVAALGSMGERWTSDCSRISSSLDEEEKRFLYGVNVPDMGVVRFPTMELQAFYRENGRVPKDAVEVARFIEPSQFTSAWAAERCAEDPASQFRRIAQYVNPISGTLYQSFQCEAWEPGGVFFDKLGADPVKGDPHFEYIDNQRKFGQPIPEAWLLRVYGNEPGEVLLETAIFSYTCDQWKEVPHP